MKTCLQMFVCILLICTLIIGIPFCLSGCSEVTGNQEQAPALNRFVEIDESMICAEYNLGTDGFLSDGSKEADIYYYRYLVDRVSRLVYIEIRETGQHSSGIEWLECHDTDGNHMKYIGELPE